MEELDRKLNELAHRIGMERQHKKLIRELIVHLTQEWYHMGYEEGWEDHQSIMIDEGKLESVEFSPDYNDGHDSWTEIKENSE